MLDLTACQNSERTFRSAQEVYNGLASTIEYNRWLVTEENWKVAEDTRETLGQIRDFRRAVREDRLSKGRQRANESRSQRGEAQRKVQEHHMQNAAGGSEVKSLVDNWNDQLSTQRRAWSDYGSSLKTVLKPDLKKVKADNQEEKAKLVSGAHPKKASPHNRRHPNHLHPIQSVRFPALS